MTINDSTTGVRLATDEDRTYFSRLLYLANVFGDEQSEIKDCHLPDLETYIDDWSPRIDGGVIALSDFKVPAGGTWLRYFTGERKGDAYLANPEKDSTDQSHWATKYDPESIPELCIAVERRYAGLGVGAQLLRNVCDLAAEQGAPAIALWVDSENDRASRLYRKEGFEPIEVEGQKPGQMVKYL